MHPIEPESSPAVMFLPGEVLELRLPQRIVKRRLGKVQRDGNLGFGRRAIRECGARTPERRERDSGSSQQRAISGGHLMHSNGRSSRAASPRLGEIGSQAMSSA